MTVVMVFTSSFRARVGDTERWYSLHSYYIMALKDSRIRPEHHSNNGAASTMWFGYSRYKVLSVSWESVSCVIGT